MTVQSTLASLATVLAQQTACHPRLSIAYANLWIDPLYSEPLENYIEYDEGEEAIAAYALGICRALYRENYYTMLNRLRHDPAYGPDEVIDDFKELIHQHYPFIPISEIDDYYTICRDIPTPFYGWSPFNPDYGPTVDPDHLDLLRILGLQPIPHSDEEHNLFEPDTVVFDEDAWGNTIKIVVRPIIDSCIHLVKHHKKEQPYADLAFLLMRLFMISGNSSIDYSAEEFWESGFQPLDWCEENLKLANVVCAEASLIMEAADRALNRLETDPDFYEDLKRIAALLRDCHEKGLSLSHESLPWLDRPLTKRGTPDYPRRKTAAHTAVLYLRRCYGDV